MNSERIQAVKEWLLSENVHKLQIFLDFVNFFWRFIKNYSWIAALLLNLLKTKRNKKKTEITLFSKQTFLYCRKRKKWRFSSDYSAHSSQVSEKLQKKNIVLISFSLSEAALKVFKALKKTFMSVSLLHYFNENKLIRVETDISEFAIDRILTQQFEINSQLHWLSVVYYSKKLLDTEIWYDTDEQELLVIVKVMHHWCHYCWGVRH